MKNNKEERKNRQTKIRKEECRKKKITEKFIEPKV